MKLVNVIQWVSCETANPTHLKSRPDRVIVKHTCAEVTERDRSCVERDIRLSIEPRDLYSTKLNRITWLDSEGTRPEESLPKDSHPEMGKDSEEPYELKFIPLSGRTVGGLAG